MSVITISREEGSNGEAIADLLCDHLGYCRVDKSMLTQIAQVAGVDVEAVLEKERSVANKPRLISDQMTSLYGRKPSAFGSTCLVRSIEFSRGPPDGQGVPTAIPVRF